MSGYFTRFIAESKRTITLVETPLSQAEMVYSASHKPATNSQSSIQTPTPYQAPEVQPLGQIDVSKLVSGKPAADQQKPLAAKPRPVSEQLEKPVTQKTARASAQRQSAEVKSTPKDEKAEKTSTEELASQTKMPVTNGSRSPLKITRRVHNQAETTSSTQSTLSSSNKSAQPTTQDSVPQSNIEVTVEEPQAPTPEAAANQPEQAKVEPVNSLNQTETVEEQSPALKQALQLNERWAKPVEVKTQTAAQAPKVHIGEVRINILEAQPKAAPEAKKSEAPAESDSRLLIRGL